MKTLVTGGRGRLSTALTARLLSTGIPVRVLSRGPGPAGSDAEWVVGDLRSGWGIAAALRGVETVVHTATDPLDPGAVDARGTRLLAEAATRSDVAHFVLVSIVGIDHIPLEYYRAKLVAEEAVAGSGVGHSILRVSQFHSFVDFLLGRARGIPGIIPVPAGVRVQSVAVEDVAARLAEVVGNPPSGRLLDLYGPEVLSVANAARTWVKRRQLRRAVLPFPAWGATLRALRSGHNVSPEEACDGMTWDAWLERRYG